MTVAPSYRGRFAPSPTGPLHFGSLVAAMASYLDARQQQGRWLLRIEDIDETRASVAAEDAILRTLEAFGFDWDESPVRQSERKPLYAEALERLQAMDMTYPCTCTRSEIGTHAVQGIEGPIYPGICRSSPFHPERRQAIRVRTDDSRIGFDDRIAGPISQSLAAAIGDFVIRRSDGYFAYQLAVVVDDAEQRINQIVRGADLLLSTPRQIHLQRLLGYPEPRYAHVPLVLDQQGRKLSKQDRAHPIDRHTPLVALASAWHFLAQPPPLEWPATLDEFWRWAIEQWNIDHLTHAENPSR